MTEKSKYHLLYLIGAVINASLGFLFWGYSFSVFNSLKSFIQKEVFPGVAPDIVFLIITAPFASATIGAFLAGPIATTIGRRKLLIISNLVGIGAVLTTLVSSVPIIIIGRAILGLVLGIFSVIVPLYILEISPPKYRGQTFGIASTLRSLGNLIAFIEGFAVPSSLSMGDSSQIWRILLAISIIGPLLSVLGYLFLFKHETPYFLVSIDNLEEAETSLRKINKTDVNEHLEEIIAEKDYVTSQGEVKYRHLFSKKFRNALIVSLVLMITRELSLSDVISINAQDLYSLGPKDPFETFPKVLTIVYGSVQFLTDLMKNIFSEKINDRYAVITGTFGMGLCSILYGTFGLTLGQEAITPKIFLLIWPIFYALSLSSFSFQHASLIFPPKIVALSTAVNWAFAFLTVQFYPRTKELVGQNQLFIILGGIILLAVPYFWKYLIVPKEKNQHQLLEEYRQGEANSEIF